MAAFLGTATLMFGFGGGGGAQAQAPCGPRCGIEQVSGTDDPAERAAQHEWQVPRTPWGDPDLTGAWPIDHLVYTPLQRSQLLGTRAELNDEEYEQILRMAERQLSWIEEERQANILGMGHWIERGIPLRQSSLIVEPANGRYPALTPEGERLRAAEKTSRSKETFTGMGDLGISDRCITRGMPASMLPGNYNSGIEVHQAPDLVAIRLEMIHETRLIHLGAREPPPGHVTSWLGFSVGGFEGDTLVIETTNFTPGASAGPAPNSAEMRMTERLTPIGPDEIRYEAWIEDPVVLAEPYKLDFPWRRNPGYEQYEYACHEGNHSIRAHIAARGARLTAKRAAAPGTQSAVRE